MPSSDLVQALSRGLMVIELLANSEGGMTLQQLCLELDLKPATVHNLLRTLMARGYIEKKHKPTVYTLGPVLMQMVDMYRLRELQHRVGKEMGLIFARFPFARVTYSETISGEVFLKLRITPERPGLLERPWNSVMLPYTSASVLLFQAFWNINQRMRYSQRYPFNEYGFHIWQSEEKLEQFLNEVRANGYSAPPVDQNGLLRVAVPVLGAGNEVVGALGTATVLSPHDTDPADYAVKCKQLQVEFIECLKESADKLTVKEQILPSLGA